MASPDNSATMGGSGATSPPSQKRQRAKQACEPCRLRKRRCDGAIPCNMCTSFEYRCYYERHPRKRSKLVEQNASHDLRVNPEDFVLKHEIAREDRSSREDVSTLRSMEANSGIAFTRLLGRRLDPAAVGPKLFSFGWNLGGGADGRVGVGISMNAAGLRFVTDYLTKQQMEEVARLYFANIHPLYGFLDKDFITQQIRVRWEDRNPEKWEVPDHVFANIAAGGLLFTDGPLQPILPTLVDTAKRAMESTSIMQPPTLLDVQSWLLRCLYLRATEHPHAVHMASCTLMHLVESLGLHQESTFTPNIPGSTAAEHEQTAEIRRRTFWVSRLLNTWVSFEYGRTRVHLRGITAELPTPREGDYTTDYIQLYSLSCCLDPERDDSKWEEFLRQIEAYEAPHDGIELSRANLGMCGYRRLRLANPHLSPETIARVIKLGLAGLAAAGRMLEKGMPWWHVANVPFQVICVFLAMDVRESLQHVGTAMRVLEDVVEGFKTPAMKEALKTARFLVRLSKKRKDEDSEVLGLSLLKAKGGLSAVESRAESVQPEAGTDRGGPEGIVNSVNGGGDVKGFADIRVPPAITETPGTIGSSGDDWSLDITNNADFDWNFFLTADMATFDGFVPDGVM